ncbi:MAG TPA: diguanylate cyclase [Pyrinomonadaceae bacterium]|jgi:diguanylate cyclase (GGDEF)-like protein
MQPPRGREQGRVLLVTDAPSQAYAHALEQAGFAVVGVSGGMAALVQLRGTRPHVVLIDARLTGISAEELARLLTQAQDNVPFLLFGGDEADAARREQAVRAGALDYVRVPQELSLLVARTEQLVKLKHETDRLRAEADRDYLTGLANRRRFRTALGNELERWRRYRTPCALLLVDIDHMKQINDAHGHSAGDVAIRHVAGALASLSRDNDTAARLGGEEFALLLAGATEASALAAAERLRQSVAGASVELVGAVTVSIGVAACPAHAANERALYATSDAALYRAKAAGRNCVVAAPPLS